MLGGYYLILADSRDAAVRHRRPAARSPVGSIEVRPVFDLSPLRKPGLKNHWVACRFPRPPIDYWTSLRRMRRSRPGRRRQRQMPLTKTFWSPCYGMVTDRFGIGWMVMVPGPKC